MKAKRLLALMALVGTALLTPGASRAAASEFTYITVSDGVKISVQIVYPAGFDPNGDTKWPAILQMDGYEGSSSDYAANGMDEYVVVIGSVRGSGCSGGKFDLLSWRTAQDGKEIIDDWIAKQPWSNGKVGITGHSYPGLTGFQIASLAPEHLTATAVSGLIDDYYRGIFYMGGVPNPGFPLAWEGAYRPATDAQPTIPRLLEDPVCRANINQRRHWNVVQYENIADAYMQREATPDSWHMSRSLTRKIADIAAPIQIGHQYQDEQTGPRGGPLLFEHLPEDVPSRLIMSNGKHNLDEGPEVRDWLDCWILQSGEGCGDVNDPSKRVVLHFETKGEDSLASSSTDGVAKLEPFLSSDLPLPENDWQELFLRADGTLGATPGPDGEVSYVSLPSGRQTVGDVGLGFNNLEAGNATFIDGPDSVRWEIQFDQPTAIAGSMALTLWATSTAVDTDFFVDLLDVDTATGATAYLQRGVLRASHRAIDEAKSDRIETGARAGEIFRYWHPHVAPTRITPLEPYRYDIEINWVGHAFRPGHKMVLLLHAPPPSDSPSLWAWSPEQPPAINTVLQKEGMRARILVPFMSVLPPMWATAPACGEITGEYCFTPVG